MTKQDYVVAAGIFVYLHNSYPNNSIIDKAERMYTEYAQKDNTLFDIQKWNKYISTRLTNNV